MYISFENYEKESTNSEISNRKQILSKKIDDWHDRQYPQLSTLDRIKIFLAGCPAIG